MRRGREESSMGGTNGFLGEQMGFPGDSVVKNPPTMQETQQELWVQSLDWESLLEKEMATYSSIPAWKIP